MEISQFARRIVESTALDAKLGAPPSQLEDRERSLGPPPHGPGRDEALRLRPGREVKVPPPSGLADPAQRPRILHALANHELQAVELFAWALLAFPESPEAFRRGLVRLIEDEQRHCRLYLECLQVEGFALGDFPLSGHFWRRAAAIRTPLEFVVHFGLVFESANLDFGHDYVEAAQRAELPAIEAAVRAVHADEIGHVAFAWRWFSEFKPVGSADWSIYLEALGDPKIAARARGRFFDREGRLAAGMDAEFVTEQARLLSRTPGGHLR